jgi:hypothetical protein
MSGIGVLLCNKGLRVLGLGRCSGEALCAQKDFGLQELLLGLQESGLCGRYAAGKGIELELVEEPGQLSIVIEFAGRWGREAEGCLFPLSGHFLKGAERVAKQCLSLLVGLHGAVCGNQSDGVGGTQCGVEDGLGDAKLLLT